MYIGLNAYIRKGKIENLNIFLKNKLIQNSFFQISKIDKHLNRQFRKMSTVNIWKKKGDIIKGFSDTKIKWENTPKLLY